MLTVQGLIHSDGQCCARSRASHPHPHPAHPDPIPSVRGGGMLCEGRVVAKRGKAGVGTGEEGVGVLCAVRFLCEMA